VTEADLAMQKRVESELLSAYPETVLLSEEMTVDEQQDALNSNKAVWCLDPLDGTSNFASGIPYFAVSLSLIKNNEVIMGLVYDPTRDECFYADMNTKVMLNGNNIELEYFDENIRDAVAIIDLKRLNRDLATQLVLEQPFASQRNFGASALDWCWLAVNRGQLYLHGKQNIWDYSAGQYIFHKMGGFSSTLDGNAIFSNKLEGRSVVAAVNKPLFENCFDCIQNN
jgi:myo-inositol-1(or 4)-monophosphatase